MQKSKFNNSGFSLIELIVVIAIMAILVGAMAPRVTKYIESAKRASDVQALGTVFTAVQTTLIEAETSDTITVATAGTYVVTGDAAVAVGGNASFDAAVKTLITGNTYPTLTSKALAGQPISVTITSTGAVAVEVNANSAATDVSKVTVSETGSNWTKKN